ncbi:hypothetical protein QQP08_008158 [Theobroma cacao]|nr:hypothetical protein QQP08_006108 [Theobroma cacao]WRX15671.1 hypothetical protein QQP08_008158 [Theobroma cacao]
MKGSCESGDFPGTQPRCGPPPQPTTKKGQVKDGWSLCEIGQFYISGSFGSSEPHFPVNQKEKALSYPASSFASIRVFLCFFGSLKLRYTFVHLVKDARVSPAENELEFALKSKHLALETPTPWKFL